LAARQGALLTHLLSAACFGIGVVFVWRSFYAMRIRVTG